MKILNEWSGKEWIPPEALGRVPGEWLDVPQRVYIKFKHGTIIIGRNRTNKWTQGWLPFLGSMPTEWKWSWWPIIYRPRHQKPGWLYRKHPEWYGRTSKDSSQDA